MTLNSAEIRRLLDVSLSHSVVVDVREIVEAPGNLRTVTIHQGNDVTIEFERCTDYLYGTGEGGGLKYIGHYEAVDELVRDLEVYLGKPVSAWSNYTESPYEPKVLDETDPAANLKYFEDLVRNRKMDLPSRGNFELAGIYWRHIELFGEFRQDRLGEETEISLRKRGILPEEEDV
jgi:hypothetical protein